MAWLGFLQCSHRLAAPLAFDTNGLSCCAFRLGLNLPLVCRSLGSWGTVLSARYSTVPWGWRPRRLSLETRCWENSPQVTLWVCGARQLIRSRDSCSTCCALGRATATHARTASVLCTVPHPRHGGLQFHHRWQNRCLPAPWALLVHQATCPMEK